MSTRPTCFHPFVGMQCLQPVMKHENRVFDILHKAMQEEGDCKNLAAGSISFHALFLRNLLYALNIVGGLRRTRSLSVEVPGI